MKGCKVHMHLIQSVFGKARLKYNSPSALPPPITASRSSSATRLRTCPAPPADNCHSFLSSDA
eukprot:287970-Karenia_brevis.AAC.1